MSNQESKKKLSIGRIGRKVGLKGELRFFNLSDFPQQFKKGSTFPSDRGELTIEYYNPKRGVIKFKGINSPQEAQKLTNAYLYSDEESTKESISLEEGEYFWFDILGSEIVEEGERLGKVEEIERLPSSDYLVVKTDPSLTKEGLPKKFLIPFIDKFIQEVDLEKRVIHTAGAKEILKAS